MADRKILVLTGDFTEDYETMVPVQALAMLGFQLAKNFSLELQAVELRRSGYLPVFWKYFIRG